MQTQSSTYKTPSNLAEIIWLGRRTVEPKQEMTVSQWAEKRRMLTRAETTRPGQWDNNLVPFAIKIMDAFSKPEVKKITFVGSAQVVKTEIIKNAVGYSIDQEPKKILLVYPTEDDARDFSREKLQPMIDRNPTINEKVSDVNDKKDNKTLYKKFAGGALWMVGSNSPNSLARRSVQWVIGDDVDRIPVSAGNEGDPLLLAEERTESYSLFEYKHAAFSTPTEKHNSRIERRYLQGNQSLYYVKCPFCNAKQTLEWEQLKWEKEKDLFGEKTTKHIPETAAYECIECKELIDESYKASMLAGGEWIAKYPERTEHESYWINRLYSPFSTWENLIKKFLLVKDDPDLLKTFWNTSLARTWEDVETESIEEKGLLKRVEDYLTAEHPYMPNGVLVLTASIDVQGDRLEMQVMGFGIGEESWVITREVFTDNPQQDDVWETAFDFAFDSVFRREDGVELQIVRLFIDNGAYTKRVNEVLYNVRKEMKFSVRRKLDPSERKNFGVWGIKGKAGMDRPLIPRNYTVSYKRMLYTMVIGVDQAKTSIFRRLAITKPGPKYIHFTKAVCDVEYFEQLLAERRIAKASMRGTTYYWALKKKGMRNEVFDLTVYCVAAITHLNPNYEKIKEKLLKQKEVQDEKEKTEIEKVKKVATKKVKLAQRRSKRRRVSNWN